MVTRDRAIEGILQNAKAAESNGVALAGINKYHALSYITQLEDENAALRGEYGKLSS